MTGRDDYTRIPPVPDSVFVAPLRKPDGLGADWLEGKQRRYGADEHRTWDELYERQMKLVPGRACREFLHGLDRLGPVPEREKALSRREDVSEGGVLRHDRSPRGEVAGAAVAEPSAAQAYVHVLRRRELAPRGPKEVGIGPVVRRDRNSVV